MIYIGIGLILVIAWWISFTTVPFPLRFIIPGFFAWVIFGQLFLNILARIFSRSFIPKQKTNDQKDHLPNHYRVSFSREARVHFLGVWFVSNSKTCVQAFTY